MSTHEESHEATVGMFENLLGSGDAKQVEQTIDEFVVLRRRDADPAAARIHRCCGDEAGVRSLHTAFPDLPVEIDDLIAEDDNVAARNSVTGTHRGEFMGLAAAASQRCGASSTWPHRCANSG